MCATLFDADNAVWLLDERLLALDGALQKLETLDRRAAKVIEWRFFGGDGSRGGPGNLGYYIENGIGTSREAGWQLSSDHQFVEAIYLPERYLREVLAKR